MNRNRVSDGGQARAASNRQPTPGQAGAEVIYVGRASTSTNRDGRRFQEMPESPWATKESPAPADPRWRSGAVSAAGVPAPIAPSSSGATVILGINLSGPIVLEPGPSGVPVRLDDSNGTVLPAGELSLPYVPRSASGSFPSAVTALMTAAAVAFSMGFLMSPLGGRLISRAGGALPAAGVAVSAVSPVRPVAPSPLPLIVPTTAPIPSLPSVRAKASPPRTSRGVAKVWASGKRGGSRKPFASAPASSVRAAFDVESGGGSADTQPSRKSVEKESVDLTKQGAKPAKPWVDPWAD
jgi:hypothetical protein